MEIDMLRLHHYGVEDTLELLVEHHVPHAGEFLGILFGEPVPEPDDFLWRRVLNEKHLAVLRVRVPRGEEQDGLLLVNAAQIEQFGVLPERMSGVATAWILIVRNEQCHRVFRHLADHIAAVAGVKFS